MRRRRPGQRSGSAAWARTALWTVTRRLEQPQAAAATGGEGKAACCCGRGAPVGSGRSAAPDPAASRACQCVSGGGTWRRRTQHAWVLGRGLTLGRCPWPTCVRSQAWVPRASCATRRTPRTPAGGGSTPAWASSRCGCWGCAWGLVGCGWHLRAWASSRCRVGSGGALGVGGGREGPFLGHLCLGRGPASQEGGGVRAASQRCVCAGRPPRAVARRSTGEASGTSAGTSVRAEGANGSFSQLRRGRASQLSRCAATTSAAAPAVLRPVHAVGA